jgi:hypothetical protein
VDSVTACVEEVRRARDRHARKHKYDLDAIYAGLKAREKQEHRKVVNLMSERRKKTAWS